MSALPTYLPATPALRVVGVVEPDIGTDQSAWRTKRTSLARAPRVKSRCGIEFKIASSREELSGAFRLLYRSYRRAGLMKANRYRMRVTPWHLLNTTEVFVAVDCGRVVSTVSLIGDGDLGLPMEAVYPDEITSRRLCGRHLGEVSCLADRRCGQTGSLSIVVRLMALMAQCAERRGIDELLIAVHPRHTRFYERCTAFEPIGEERTYAAVNNHPAVALSLDLGRAPIDHPHLYKKFFGTPYPHEVLRYQPLPIEVHAELSCIVRKTCVGRSCPRRGVLVRA